MSKSILITGSTDGIGKLAAIKLAKEGHTVFVHGRNAEKLTAVVEEIKSTTNNNTIKGYLSDFSDLKSAQDMAMTLREDIPHLDVLINNAGVYKSPESHTKDALDTRIVVNFYASYILTNALLPLIKKGTDSRIVNLSSAAQSTVQFKLLAGTEAFSEQDAYAQSKLAILMWSFYLAKSDPELSVIALNPGSLLDTNMVREAFGKFWSPADKGADIIYDLALSDKLDNASGSYFDNDKGDFGKAHADAYDTERVENLIINTDAVLNRVISRK